MKYLSDMTEKEKYDLAYQHYLNSRAANGKTAAESISLRGYKSAMSLSEVEAILIMYEYAH